MVLDYFLDNACTWFQLHGYEVERLNGGLFLIVNGQNFQLSDTEIKYRATMQVHNERRELKRKLLKRSK